MKQLLTVILTLAVASPALSQTPPYAHEYRWDNMLDPSNYDPDTDPDIDMFISHWEHSMPGVRFGALVVRDILTPLEGEPLFPKRKGAVLTKIGRIAYGSLQPGDITVPSRLEGEQLVFYIHKGEGTITSGGVTEKLRPDVGVLMPPHVDFSMENTGSAPLTMFMVSDPAPAGAETRGEMLVRDLNGVPPQTTDGHWANISTSLFDAKDGLVSIGGMATVSLEPYMIAHPHSHDDDEEAWFAIDGDIILLLGRELRKLPVGSAYKVPTDGVTAHAAINVTDTPIKLMWIEQPLPRGYHSDKPFARLDPWPYTPERDPDIDMFIGDWRESLPRHTHGSLLERDILTKGDPLTPPRRGAVLSYVNRFVHATLHAGAVTEPVTLDGEQEIFYVLDGAGEISAAGETRPLKKGISVLVPDGLEFTMRNTGDAPMTMYMINEPCPDGFRPNSRLLVVDENTQPVATSNAHWVGVVRQLLTTGDGLGTLESVLTCSFYPMTFFQPHSHEKGVEEVWTALDDNTWAFLGKQLRFQKPGTAYLIPVDNKTPHANFNVSDEPVKLFYFARYRDHELRE